MNPHVMIGMPCASGSVPWATHRSIVNTALLCQREKVPLDSEGPIGCSVVTWARDLIVAKFLKSTCTHLFWIDADIEWAPKDFLRLVAAACGPYNIIGAAYALKSDPPRAIINLPEESKIEVNGHGNVRVKSLPLGFTIVKREVIEKVVAGKLWMKVDGIDCPDLFRLGRREDGEAVGEDVYFYEDAAAAGYTPWLDPSIRLGHIGSKPYQCDIIAALGLEEFAQEKAA